MRGDEGIVDPAVIAFVWKQLNGELELAIERLAVTVGIYVDEVAGLRNRKAILAKEPLVHFHLPLVRLSVGIIQGDGFHRARRFVIDYEEIAERVDPHVVDGSEKEEVRGGVEKADPAKRLAPLIDPRIAQRHGVDPVLRHERVGSAIEPMNVELLLEKRIDGIVKRERRAVGAADAEPSVEVKTARTLKEELQFAAAQCIRFRR